MAYVVARRNGRFEIRESLHTPEGPRARTLAGFEVLTDEILTRAAEKARRPFDASAVLASSRRAGAPAAAVIANRPTTGELDAEPAIRGTRGSAKRTGDAQPETGASPRRFVEVSRRMAHTMGRAPTAGRTDPGAALINLLGFADAVTRNQPVRPFEPLAFPALSRLVKDRGVSGAHSE